MQKLYDAEIVLKKHWVLQSFVDFSKHFRSWHINADAAWVKLCYHLQVATP